MLLLFETAAGFALFKVVDQGKLKKVDDLFKEFNDVESAQKIVSLKKFKRFKNTADALKATTAIVESKLSKSLKKFLERQIVKKNVDEELAVSDTKLGSIIKDQLGIQCVHDASVAELIRGIRNQVENLISGVSGNDLNAMSLGLSHSLSRYKLKFSPDKVDTMIVQAIALLDDLDKELNTYAMRVREWYGWHFPELSKVIPDNILYAKAVRKMGDRTNAAKTDFSDFLPAELEEELKEVSQISMGTEVSEEDIENILELCDQVISISQYRDQLSEYLKNRMAAIAPNLTVLVGELVGARLIAHAGSLLSLAKYPASTVQILGAEKALFRALKTKHETPKYGLIYHASLIGQTAPKFKGKISRVLAAKVALAVRYDVLCEGETTTDVGTDGRQVVEARMQSLETGQIQRVSGTANKGSNKQERTNTPQRSGSVYNNSADSTLKKSNNNNDSKNKNKRKGDFSEETQEAPEEAQTEETSNVEKKKKKKKKAESDE